MSRLYTLKAWSGGRRETFNIIEICNDDEGVALFNKLISSANPTPEVCIVNPVTEFPLIVPVFMIYY